MIRSYVDKRIKIIVLQTEMYRTNMKCGPIDDSDQPGYPPTLTEVFSMKHVEIKGPCPIS